MKLFVHALIAGNVPGDVAGMIPQGTLIAGLALLSHFRPKKSTSLRK